MERTTLVKIEQTVNVLCEWIQNKCEKGASSEELAILPEVVNATAGLIKAYYN